MAQNEKFELMQNGGGTGIQRFWNGLYPSNIDLPQRFGDKSYGRVDWGQSTVRADLFGVTAGLSNANMGWGPATDAQYTTKGAFFYSPGSVGLFPARRPA